MLYSNTIGNSAIKAKTSSQNSLYSEKLETNVAHDDVVTYFVKG